MSRRCEYYQFIPVMIISIVMSLAINTLLTPLVWIKLIVKSLGLKKRRFKTCLVITLLYLPFSVIVIAKDLVVYSKKIYEKPKIPVS